MWRVRSLSARETVAGCTPARSATSLNFTGPGLISERLSGCQRRPEIERAHARIVEQVAPARAQLHYAAVHHGSVVGDLEPRTRVLLHEQNREPTLLQAPDHREHALARLGVEPHRR